jgi:hypothetical protein
MKLEEIENLCEKATLGPWYWDSIDEIVRTEAEESNVWTSCGALLSKEDGNFIAASRALVPKLLAVAKACKKFLSDPNRYERTMMRDAMEDLEEEKE